MKYLLLAAAVLLSACDALPRDPAGTTQRIERSKSFRIGFASQDIEGNAPVRSLIAALEDETKARAVIVSGGGEGLLSRLQEGDLDIVIGRFKSDSPWQTEIAFGPALATEGRSSGPVELKAAMRNGENRWITQVERASRIVIEGGAR